MATGFPIIFTPRLWSPRDIPTEMWFDASDRTTITLNGSTVSQWNDKSGNNRNVSQSTASSQPTYLSAGLNGRPALRADGNDFLLGSISLSSITDKLSVFCMATMNTSTASYGRLLSYTATGDPDDNQTRTSWSLVRNVNLESYLQYRFNGIISTISTTYLVPSIIGMIYDGSNGRLFEDGTASAQGVSTGNFGTSGTFRVFYDGSVSYWNGLLSEMVFTTTALSTLERQKLEGYLAWKWGTVASLPSTHPYKNSPPYAS